jgi:phosphoglycan beta-1,3-galactosyltransferase
MTQKLILWLEYAYHAFPDVPYIMKSDDDTYLKVPQFLRNIRHIRSGFKDAFPEVAPAVRDAPGITEKEPCIYWGSKYSSRKWGRLRYHTGSGYMLHRRLVQVFVGGNDARTLKQLQLTLTPYDMAEKRTYTNLVMDVEDAFVGSNMREKGARARAVCPSHRALHISEDMRSFYDVLWSRGKSDWSGLLIHHVTAFSEHYMHYYFQHEHKVAESIKKSGRRAERKANAAAAQWVRLNLPSTTVGYDKFVKLKWSHPRHTPSSQLSPGDNVWVYDVRYKRYRAHSLDGGYVSVIPR